MSAEYTTVRSFHVPMYRPSLNFARLLGLVFTLERQTMFPTSSVGTLMVFNDTFTTSDDDLVNAKCLFWNKALWN
ncbi:hypothetical protein GQ600_735 [Phytophthora cactorum]|nr:hypothetical protein GQ600_735 [Phytophthora cactorum]